MNRKQKITTFWGVTVFIGVVIGIAVSVLFTVSISSTLIGIYVFTTLAGYAMSIIVSTKKSVFVDLPFLTIMLRIFLGMMMLTTMLFILFKVDSPYILRAYLLYTLLGISAIYRFFKVGE